MEYYTAIKYEILLLVTKWSHAETIMLIEVNQPQKYKIIYFDMGQLPCKVQNK